MTGSWPLRRSAAAALVAALAFGAAGWAATRASGAASPAATVPADTLRAYVAAVEKVRLPVNALLERADPILRAYHHHAVSPTAAARRMARLEEAFAGYLLAAQQVAPTNPTLRAVDAPYARTYLYEDAYLATLAADLRDGGFDNLPQTQDAQRLAIITWRTHLEQFAAADGVALPADLQQAGRGEIAPSPEGGS